MIRHVDPAEGKGNIHRGNPKVRTCRKKQRTHSVYNKGMNCQGAKQQAQQRMRRASNRTARKTTGPKIERRLIRSANQLWEKNNGTFWKICPPPKRKISSAAEQLRRSVCGSIDLSRIKKGKKKTGLVHQNGLHLMKESLGMSGLKEGTAGVAREESPRGSNHR
jgi:hypothetical protein